MVVQKEITKAAFLQLYAANQIWNITEERVGNEDRKYALSNNDPDMFPSDLYVVVYYVK